MTPSYFYNKLRDSSQSTPSTPAPGEGGTRNGRGVAPLSFHILKSQLGHQSCSRPHSHLKSSCPQLDQRLQSPQAGSSWNPAQQVQVMLISVSKSLRESYCSGVPQWSRVTDSSWPRSQAFFSSSQLSGECWIYRE